MRPHDEGIDPLKELCRKRAQEYQDAANHVYKENMSETKIYQETEAEKNHRLPSIFDAYLKELERAEKEGTRRPYVDSDFMPTMRRVSDFMRACERSQII